MIGIIAVTHFPQPPHARGPVVPDDILIIARVVHELVGQVGLVVLCEVLDRRVDSLGRGVGGQVVGCGPVAGVEDEPGLVQRGEAEGVGAAGMAGEDRGGGDGLEAEG